MAAAPTAENRLHKRHICNAGVSFYQKSTCKDYLARSVNVSKGGMLMFVSPTIPVKAGQQLTVRMCKLDNSELEDLSRKEVPSVITRVERRNLLSHGQLEVGVKFQC